MFHHILTNELSCCVAVHDGVTETVVESEWTSAVSDRPQIKADILSSADVSSERANSDGDRRRDDDGSITCMDKMTVCRNNNSYNDKFPR